MSDLGMAERFGRCRRIRPVDLRSVQQTETRLHDLRPDLFRRQRVLEHRVEAAEECTV